VRTTLARIGGAIAVLLGFLVPTLTAATASAAPAVESTCVGVVVDPGHGKPSTDCIPYTAGLTGAKVLEKAGHKLAFASSGLLCQIDGYPAACKSDAKHYWSYYLRKPNAAASAWGYATQGPATQKVASRETDAFVYVNGADRRPTAVTYDSIAAAAAPSSAPSSAAPSNSAAPSSAAPSSTHAKTLSTSEAPDKGSSHTGLIIAIVVVVVLVVAAGLQLMLRRRRAS
jgi:hypothetical protein